MNVGHTDDDRIYSDHYDAEALEEILDTQHKITEYTQRDIVPAINSCSPRCAKKKVEKKLIPFPAKLLNIKGNAVLNK